MEIPWKGGWGGAAKYQNVFQEERLGEQIGDILTEGALHSVTGFAAVGTYYWIKSAYLDLRSNKKREGNKGHLLDSIQENFKRFVRAVNADVDSLFIIMSWLQDVWNSEVFASQGEYLRRELLVKFANAGMLFMCDEKLAQDHKCIMNGENPAKVSESYTQSARGLDPTSFHDCTCQCCLFFRFALLPALM